MANFDISRAIDSLISGNHDQIATFIASQRALKEEAEKRQQDLEMELALKMSMSEQEPAKE